MTDEAGDQLDELAGGSMDNIYASGESDPLIEELRKTQAALRRESAEREKAISAESAERRKGTRRNLMGVLVGVFAATLAVWLSISTVQAQRRQNTDRVSARLVTCRDSNEKEEAIVKVTRALISASQATPERPRSEAEGAARQQALRIFVEDQGFKLADDGETILAPFMDCNLFKESPAEARARRVYLEHPPK